MTLEDEAHAAAMERYPDDPDHTIWAIRSMKREGFVQGYLAASRREPSDKVWPPDGWFPFGSHVDWRGPLEFSEETTEDGMPAWERHVPAEPPARELRECTICGEQVTISNATPEWEARHKHPEPSDTDEREVPDLMSNLRRSLESHRQGQITEAERQQLALLIDPNALEVDAYPWPLNAADRVIAAGWRPPAEEATQ